jgi:beta-lactamase superfamily II metal-dependent hydrolase
VIPIELLPPAPDEIEVSVFGPGYGEAIVVHIGDGLWVIVDSCQQRDVENPAPLDYLLRLGFEPQDAVKLIVATHWHDDHIRGMSKIVNACPSAPFVCSAALNKQEFRKFAALSQQTIGTSMPKGTDEIGSVFNRLVERNQKGQSRRQAVQYSVPKLAVADKLLLREELGTNRSVEVTIYSLSPSDAEIRQAIALFSTLTRDAATPLVAPISQRKSNHASVVLWFKIGKYHLLLGADLEVTGDPNTGWLAILQSPSIQAKAEFFKVPHHGSQNGDHDEIWSQLLVQDPIAVLTPYRLGRHFLPTDSDITRLLTRTANVYVTAPPTARKPRLKRVVRQYVELMTRSMTEYYSGWGHIRLRQRIHDNSQWQVELFGDAYKLTMP